jgi:hypothetical protein
VRSEVGLVSPRYSTNRLLPTLIGTTVAVPISDSFASRLLPILDGVAHEFGTPFHIYDEAGIVEGGAPP